jgi:hypothetical protein
MADGIVLRVPAPIESYDAVHAEVARRSAGEADGLLLHVGRATEDGYQVLEIWESKEKRVRFFDDVVGPAAAAVSDGRASSGQPVMEEFDPRGLIIPSAGVAY